jgi:hypothetical protein
MLSMQILYEEFLEVYATKLLEGHHEAINENEPP